LLDGDPTARVEHGQAETVSVESFKAWLAELQARAGHSPTLAGHSTGADAAGRPGGGPGGSHLEVNVEVNRADQGPRLLLGPAHDVESSGPAPIVEGSAGGEADDTGCATAKASSDRAKCPAAGLEAAAAGGGGSSGAAAGKSSMD